MTYIENTSSYLHMLKLH